MKIEYVPRKFKPEKREMIDRANQIINAYLKQGLRLTLRQLYYQFVTRNWLPNTERSYKNLGSAVSDGRLAGLIDWAAIEDRVRIPKVPNEFRDLAHLAETAVAAYRLPRREGQERYVELWVEKDALAGVLAPIARDFHVTLMVNRGYSSQSAMYESAERFIDSGKPGTLLYLGDHDPSGEDMVRDVGARLETFGADVEVEKLALTFPQVEEFNPPPNPAKMSDTRAAGYVALHGESSWEVDALPPEELTRIIETRLQELTDQDAVDEVIEREEADKAALREAVKGIMGGV